MKSRRGSQRLPWVLVLWTFLGTAGRLQAGTLPVSSTADAGPGTLRQAILDANSTPGIDNIVFAIPGSGVQTIQLLSSLPDISEGVLIDGYSQPGASPNTNPPGQGFNTVLMVEVLGAGTGTSCFTYRATSGHVLGLGIQGLAIGHCTYGVRLTAEADHVQISGNFIGVDASGNAGINFPDGAGIRVEGASSVDIHSNLISGAGGNGIGIYVIEASSVTAAGNLVGTNAAGDTAIPNGIGITVFCSSPSASNIMIGDGNVVSGNAGSGILDECAGGLSIQGNFIGTDATGRKPLGNGDGIALEDYGTVTGNVIAGNGAFGLSVGSSGGLVQGNFIGTDAAATIDLGNAENGIFGDQYAVIGGTGPGEGNVIAHNGFRRPANQPLRGGGVLAQGIGIDIRGNRIFDNWPLGIDVFGPTDGVTPNDPGDPDFNYAGNPLQNFPLITSVVPGTSTTHIEGSLNSTASQTFGIDLFANSACQRYPHEYLQGETYLKSLPVTTGGFGNATFAVDVPVVLAPGQPVTATATDQYGNTSEFTTQRIVFSVEPLSGPAAGGATVTIYGMLFEPGSSVTVGGVPATNVVPMNPGTITATMPARPPGTASDVTVHDPSGTTGTLRNGWVADFTDVPPSNFFRPFIATLIANEVTAGCGNGIYCPGSSVTRAQMAVFLLRSKRGVCYVPAPATGLVFADVPAGSFAAAWIEALAAAQVTGGCGGGNYCPGDPVTRAQMAVFLLRTLEGPIYAPPDCTAPTFSDVPCSSGFARWIDELAKRGVTAGCGGGNYCPSNPVTRGQMAVFLATTFSLP